MNHNRLIQKMALRYLIWSCPFFFLGLFPYPLPSWAATAKVDIIQSRDQYPAGDSYPIRFRIRISSPWYIQGTQGNLNGLIPTVLTFAGSPGIRLEGIQFPEPEKKKFEYTREQIEVFSGEILVQANLVVSKNTFPGTQVIKGELSYQACSSRSCLLPEKVPIVLSLSITPREVRAERQKQAVFDSEDGGPAFNKSVAGWRFGPGLWLTLLGIFFGGMALNLTPCVYPLIPITVSYFGGRSGRMRGRTLFHGLLYLTGLALTNSLLGLAASLSGGLLGSALQNPIVLIVVAGILLSLGLSFFGFWELKLPTNVIRVASKNFGGYFGTFFIGLTLGIVAAPCLGPFILGLLTYVGQKGDPFLGLLYFFVLSIGLGLPLSVLAIFSGTLEKLPMSGEWMIWIRKVFGWVLVGVAGYMLQPLITEPIGKSALLAAVFVSAGLHLGWLERSGGTLRVFPYLKKVMAVILICGSIIFFLRTLPSGVSIQWVPYSKAVLVDAAKINKPVILDFYADWCVPCREMEKKVFMDPEVVELSQHFVTARVDMTKRHPSQKELRTYYQIRGLPTIIFINRRGVEERVLRIESYVSQDEVLKRMKRLIEKSRSQEKGISSFKMGLLGRV